MVTNKQSRRITTGTFGELHVPEGAKRRCRRKIYGVVVCAVDEKKFKVRFDYRDGIEL